MEWMCPQRFLLSRSNSESQFMLFNSQTAAVSAVISYPSYYTYALKWRVSSHTDWLISTKDHLGQDWEEDIRNNRKDWHWWMAFRVEMFDVWSNLTSKRDLSIVALWAKVSYLFLSSATSADDSLTVESNACSLLSMCWCSARPVFVVLFFFFFFSVNLLL